MKSATNNTKGRQTVKQKDRQNASSIPARDNAMLTIGKVAKLAAVSIDTIRYYERGGLLCPAQKSAAGYCGERRRRGCLGREHGVAARGVFAEAACINAGQGISRQVVQCRSDRRWGDTSLRRSPHEKTSPTLLTLEHSLEFILLANTRRKEVNAMALQTGERYRCPDPQCGCENENSPQLAAGYQRGGFALKIRDFQTSGQFSKRSKLRGIRPVAIEVAKGAQPGSGGDLNPRCCCGKEMQRA